MPFVKVHENRYVDTDEIANIDYRPPIPVSVDRIGQAAAQEPITSQIAPSIRIVLKSGAEIDLAGDEAELVWKDFQEAMKADTCKPPDNPPAE
jgi:hypothetical protein